MGKGRNVLCWVYTAVSPKVKSLDVRDKPGRGLYKMTFNYKPDLGLSTSVVKKRFVLPTAR